MSEYKRNKKQKPFYAMIISIIFAILSIIVIVNECTDNIEADLEQQTRQSMADVTQQNVAALQSELKVKYGLLISMARGIPEDLEGIQEHLYMMHESRDIYRFKRMGFIEPDGDAITSDGYEVNLGSLEIVQSCLAGNIEISQSMEEVLGEDRSDVNAIAVPVYEKEGTGIRGVLFATYSTEIFSELLSIASYNEYGVSCVIQSNGDVIVGSDLVVFSERENLFDRLLSYGSGNREAITTMRSDIENAKSGFIKYSTVSDKYMYYMPVSVMNDEIHWYILTIVPTAVMDARMDTIQSNIGWLVSLVLISVLICVAVCAFNYMLHHAQLKKVAYRDPLTEGDNYNAFRFKLRQKSTRGYLVSLDIEEFKLINNVCGVGKGDELIRTMWNVIERHLQDGEHAAHISGDQFVLFLRAQDMDDVIGRVLEYERNLEALSVSLTIPSVITKFGIFEMLDSGDPEDGYGKANLAKKSIQNPLECCYAVYDEELRQKRLREQWLEEQFEIAIKTGQFEVWYQPKFSPKKEVVVSAEALCRWRGANGQMLYPGEFIPLFERNGMIARLDEYVFRKVCEEQMVRFENGQNPFPVSVNLSRTSLFLPDVVERYLAILNEIGLPQELVVLEVTESAMVDDGDVEGVIRQFYDEGFRMSLDDFGSGYSSLATLNMKCFHSIKLDKSLIDGIGDNNGELLLKHIIELAHSLRLSITAEGVEHEYQVQFLRSMNCDDIQGYYYFRPLPRQNYEEILCAGAV